MVIIIKWLPQCDELIVSMRAGRGESLSPATAAAGGFLHELGTGRYRGVKSSCPYGPGPGRDRLSCPGPANGTSSR